MGMHLCIVKKLIKSDNQMPILVNKTGRNLLKEGQKKINTSQKDERKEKKREGAAHRTQKSCQRQHCQK